MATGQPSFFSLARRSFWMLFGGIWLFVGVLLFVFGVVFALREGDFAANSSVASGIVLEKKIIPADSDSSTQYRVSYRFTTPEGRVIEGSDAVSVDMWEGLVERGPIDVRYLRGRPDSNRLTLGSDLVGSLIFLLMGFVFGGIGGVLFFRATRGVLKARRLLRVGVPADGKVTAVEPTNVSVNRRPQFKVLYSYRDAQGKSHEGDSGYLGFEEATLWSPGDVAHIRYDADRPEESYWLGASDPAREKPASAKPLPESQPPVALDAPPPIDAPPVDAPPPIDAPPAG